MPRRVLVALLLLLAGFLAWRLQPPPEEAPVAVRTSPVRASLPVPSTAPVARPETAPRAASPAETAPTPGSEDAFLVGRVTCRETGAPIPLARVAAWSGEALLQAPSADFPPDPAATSEIGTETDREGNFRLRVPSGFGRYLLQCRTTPPYSGFEVWPSPEGTELRLDSSRGEAFGRERIEALAYPALSPLEERRHDLTLSRGEGFILTLTRSDTGQPMEGVRLFFRIPHVSGDPCREYTDGWLKVENGRFELGAVPPETYRLRDGKLHLVRGAARRELLLKDHPMVDGRIRVTASLDPGGIIRGFVMGVDGRPYAKPCTLSYWPVSRPKETETVDLAPDGTFLLEGLSPKEEAYGMNLTGMEDAILPRPVTARVGADVVLRLEDGWRLSGRVLDARGAPVPDARVWAWFEDEGSDSCRRTGTDAEGRYELPPLRARTGLTLAAFPPETRSIAWVPGQDPVGGSPDRPKIPASGWRKVPPGMPSLDLTLDASVGLRDYP